MNIYTYTHTTLHTHTHIHRHTYVYIYIYIYHHHHVVPLARISLTLSRHFSLSFLASGRSSGLHPVSSHSRCMSVRAGRPAFARPCVGVYRSTSLMSSSLLLQQCLACLVRLTWIVFVMGGRWPYSWCLVGYIYIYICVCVCVCVSAFVYIYLYMWYLFGFIVSWHINLSGLFNDKSILVEEQ